MAIDILILGLKPSLIKHLFWPIALMVLRELVVSWQPQEQEQAGNLSGFNITNAHFVLLAGWMLWEMQT